MLTGISLYLAALQAIIQNLVHCALGKRQTMKKKNLPDLIFLALLGIGLFVLSETNTIHKLFELPFVSLSVTYAIGRMVGSYTAKKEFEPPKL